MRFGPEITKQIYEELKKVPIIRHVCAKFGIDHSTFYRWTGKHLAFRQGVLVALYFGRENMNGTAESVILRGIQDGEFRSASYWLNHNDPRYMQKDKGDHYLRLLDRDHRIIAQTIQKDELDFETIFEMFYRLEEDYEFELIQVITKPIVNILCRDDKDLPDILYATYQEWRDEKKKTEELTKDAEEQYGPDKE